jgi:hypothetical protein
MGSDTTIVRWLPTDFFFNRADSFVRWIDFGAKSLTEPLFRSTLEYLRGSNPPAPERVTSIDAFLEAASATPAALPSGIIFHVSRCGSTLLANILRAGEHTVMLSEAQPLAPFFRVSPFSWAPSLAAVSNNPRKFFLDALVRLYAHYGTTSVNAKILLKCYTVDILGISLIRQTWPTVPFVILIRDPIEVIVSNLKGPPGWIIEGGHFRELGWTRKEAQDMSREEYLARLVGRMCEVASAQFDNKCCVIDYSTLDSQSFFRVANLFGIDIGGVHIDEILRRDAKDPTQSKIFQADTERKQRDATSLARDCARKWADEPYHRLRALASM